MQVILGILLYIILTCPDISVLFISSGIVLNPDPACVKALIISFVHWWNCSYLFVIGDWIEIDHRDFF